MDGVVLTPLKIITQPNGDVLHGLKSSENSFVDFGEAYFSTIKQGSFKGWKKHTKMILNLIVPVGEIKFVIHDESLNSFYSVQLSQRNYQRLTISPGLLVAFKGLESENILLNIASIEHDPSESVNINMGAISYEW
jgi:dTDP-4-dehydrorhamnose 3,5-epimerase